MKEKKYPEKHPSEEKVSEPLGIGYDQASDLHIPEFLIKYREGITNLCKKHNVGQLYVFGSVLGADFKSASDIDFIVDFNEKDPILYTDLYFGLKDGLEEIFRRKIDLIELRAIKNPFFKKEVEDKKVLIYG